MTPSAVSMSISAFLMSIIIIIIMIIIRERVLNKRTVWCLKARRECIYKGSLLFGQAHCQTINRCLGGLLQGTVQQCQGFARSGMKQRMPEKDAKVRAEQQVEYCEIFQGFELNNRLAILGTFRVLLVDLSIL